MKVLNLISTLIALVCATQSSSESQNLPAYMSSITIPHQFTPKEMSRIRSRLRSLSLELSTLSAAIPLMNSDDVQMNIALGVWPTIQCLIANQDARLGPPPNQPIYVVQVPQLIFPGQTGTQGPQNQSFQNQMSQQYPIQ